MGWLRELHHVWPGDDKHEHHTRMVGNLNFQLGYFSKLITRRNHKLLHHLPTGFTVIATRQTQGRGRSSNVWLSTAGCLLFSVCVRRPVSLMRQAHPLFVQYLASMAVVEAVKAYGEGYDGVPVRLKWPNDICKSTT